MWWSTAVMFVEFGISILNLGGKGESKGGQKFLAKYVETTPGACPWGSDQSMTSWDFETSGIIETWTPGSRLMSSVQLTIFSTSALERFWGLALCNKICMACNKCSHLLSNWFPLFTFALIGFAVQTGRKNVELAAQQTQPRLPGWPITVAGWFCLVHDGRKCTQIPSKLNLNPSILSNNHAWKCMIYASCMTQLFACSTKGVAA